MVADGRWPATVLDRFTDGGVVFDIFRSVSVKLIPTFDAVGHGPPEKYVWIKTHTDLDLG